MSSSWPYGDDPPPRSPSVPLWECPGGECQCHPTKADQELFEVSIRLFSADGEAMKGARCRVLHQGQELNPDDPHADGAGWITVVVPAVPTLLLVEWAPPDTPQKPDLPFRVWYYVDVEKPGDAPTRRRLHNLGFAEHRALSANVKAFQLEYGYEVADGSAESIQENLITYHDEGRVPLRPWGTAAPAEEASSEGAEGASPQGAEDASPEGAEDSPPFQRVSFPGNALALRDGPGAERKPRGGANPADTPPPPPTKGKKALGTGSVKPPRVLPDVMTAFKKKQTCGEWFRLHVVKGSLEGYFWILGDALLWNVPENEEKWKWWDESYCSTTQNPHFGKVINRNRLCRLPCNPVEGSKVAALIMTRRSRLLKIKGKDSADISPENGELGEEDVGIGSIMPTTLLYDTLYLQADLQIPFQSVLGFGTRNVPPVHKMVNDYTKKVNTALLKAVNKSTSTTMPRSVGTPGKIWAVHPDMERLQFSHFENRTLTSGCAINYGFHKCPPKDRADPFQPASTAHGNDHGDDYSQILSAVAGYCAVRASSSDPFVWRKTVDIVTSTGAPSFAPLVAKSGKPMMRAAYIGSVRPDTVEEQKAFRDPQGAFTTQP